MTWAAGVIVSFVLGWMALASEMIWYRAYAFALLGHAQVFGALLGAYLFGLAVGAAVAATARTSGTRLMPVVIGLASLSGFVVVPVFATIIAASGNVFLPLVPVSIGAACYGGLFPLLAGAVIDNRARAGAGIGYLYAANIAGSTTGSLLTGLVLLDHLTLAQMAVAIALAGVVCAGLLSRRTLGTIATALVLAGAIIALGPKLYGRLYERLLAKRYPHEDSFARVIETRSGVIAVTHRGVVYGDGVYDGAINLDPHNGVNDIHRAYLIAALHPAPRHILMIGLSAGSWAEVVANNPTVEHLTVLEINPGYLDVIRDSADVAPLLRNPKVRIEIADGRRWLMGHEETFDMVIANTVYHWRSDASRLLSVEFLELVRRRLRPGGVFYFNTTGSERAMRTALTVFPFGWRIGNMLAVSPAPLVVDLDRFRDQLLGYRIEGRPIFDSTTTDREIAASIVSTIRDGLEPRADSLARTATLDSITDDNMGGEWTLPKTVTALFRRGR